MRKTVRMSDIAEKMGISKVTVSNALAGRTGVSPELRRQIHKMALEMGYLAKTATESSAYSIAVMVSNKYVARGESFYWEIYWELAALLKIKRAAVVFEMISIEEEEQMQMPLSLENGKCDAVIVIGKLKSAYLKEVQNKFGLKIVLLDYYNRELQADAVISDGYFGMYKMTNYLLDKGHRKIAFVGSVKATPSIMDRYHGYSRALMERGIPIREDWIVEDRDLKTGVIVIGKLPRELPTAFACNCDLTANELLKILVESGYHVPEDFSIIGFDNYAKNNYYPIGITSYEVNIKAMVKASVETVLEKLVSKENMDTVIKIVSGRIVEKESVMDH